MAKPKPNVSAEALERVAREALHAYFDDRVTGVSDPNYEEMVFLRQAEVFEALEEHVRREYESPSLKGPGVSWKIRRVLGRA